MKPLHPSQRWVIRIHALIAAAVAMVPVMVLDATLLREMPVPAGLASGAAAFLLLAYVIFAPERRYRSWGYEATEDELHVRSGLWTRARVAVPFGRVQHIDVTQGPLQRAFGLATLVLHTAGTRSNAVPLPGLEVQEAERLRDEIRSHIRQDLV